MKIEVRCRTCEQAYLLAAEFSGTTLPCPACGAADGLEVPVPRNRGPVEPLPISPQEPPDRAAAPAVEPAAVETAVEEDVVCPRCKLHFKPRRDVAPVVRSERPTVLVVEDMEYFREIARDALSGRFEVRSAANVQEARVQIAQGGIDVMVLDLTLDGTDRGLELLRGLAGKRFPILIYTAQDESEMYGETWDELQRLGADDIVMKGMNVGESLARKVCGLLGIEWDGGE